MTREEMIDEAVRRCIKPHARKMAITAYERGRHAGFGLPDSRHVEQAFDWMPSRLEAVRAEFRKIAALK